MNDKTLSLLGLIRRAGKLELGFDAAVAAAREGRAQLLLAAEDVSEKTLKNVRFEAERAGVPVIELLADMEKTGKACGKKAGVLAVTDRGFAKALEKAMGQRVQEKEEYCL